MENGEAWLRALVGPTAPLWRNQDGSFTATFGLFQTPSTLQELETLVATEKAHHQFELRNESIRMKLGKYLRAENHAEDDEGHGIVRICSHHEHIVLSSLNAPEDLGYLDQIFTNRTCSLCRLVRSILKGCVREQLQKPGAWTSCKIIPFRLNYNLENDFHSAPDIQSQSRSKQLHLFLFGEDYNFRNSDDNAHRDMCIGLLNDHRRVPDCFSLRQICDRTEIKLLKYWLQKCEEEHRPLCESTKTHLCSSKWKSMRVINVHSRRVLAAPPCCRYIALSYVWGGNHNHTFRSVRANSIDSSGNLKWLELPPVAQLPATIEDAICLTQQMSFNFLWVDALCIVQDHADHVKAQISIMDQIYAAAVLTIVAANEGNAQAPLPGVRKGSRVSNQQKETIRGIQWANMLPRSKQAVDMSIWNSRAWTLQERILSRRCLIFTQHQVFFQCLQESWCEETHAEMSYQQAPGRILNRNSLIHQPLSDTFTLDDVLQCYAFIVNLYSKRQLTHPEDILKAFTGIANVFHKNHGIQLTNGLPTIRLESTLLWISLEPLRLRTPDFQGNSQDNAFVAPSAMLPSWSWAAWHGEVKYWPEELKADERRNKILWHNKDTSDRTLVDMPKEHCEHGSEVKTFIDKFTVADRVLIFWTTSAHFKLIWADHDRFGEVIARISFIQGPQSLLRYALITDENGKHAGEILLDVTSPFFVAERCEADIHEFILLCQAKNVERIFWKDGYGGRCDDVKVFDGPPGPGVTSKILFREVEPWSYLRVMLIARRGNYAYRIAVGTVHKDAWESRRPLWGLFKLA